LICILLGSAKIKVGFAFGLFAIFSIIRYRTILISIKDMGYFFVCVALGMLNSLAVVDENPLVLISCNLFVLLMIFLLEKLDFLDNENSKDIVYDNVNLIKPENRDELIADLKERTGLEIHKVVVLSINYLKDTALIKAYYFSKISENNVSSFEDKDND
jgi:Ca2+/Na+ antiporter